VQLHLPPHVYMYMCMFDVKQMSGLLLPEGSDAVAVTNRAHVRKWFGWVRTAHYYQLKHCHDKLCFGPNLKDAFPDKEVHHLDCCCFWL
jgi:hypothetical protein